MKAMIFAAGLGTRLKPLTDSMPKALVPVAGQPLIEHVARKLKAAGFGSAVVNVHHFADLLEDWTRRQEWMDFQISDERRLLLDTGGAVLHARKLLEGSGKFLVHNVDILSDADLGDLFQAHDDSALATLLVSNRKTSRHFLFEAQSMRLVGWNNSATGETIMCDNSLSPSQCLELAYSGIMVLSDKVFTVMDGYVAAKGLSLNDGAGAVFGIRDFLLFAASRNYGIYGRRCDELHMLDVGKCASLEEAEKMLKK